MQRKPYGIGDPVLIKKPFYADNRVSEIQVPATVIGVHPGWIDVAYHDGKRGPVQIEHVVDARKP